MKKFLFSLFLVLTISTLSPNPTYASHQNVLANYSLQSFLLYEKLNNREPIDETSFASKKIYDDEYSIPLYFYQDILKEIILLKSNLANENITPDNSSINDIRSKVRIHNFLNGVADLALMKMNLRATSHVIMDKSLNYHDDYLFKNIFSPLLYEVECHEHYLDYLSKDMLKS